MFESRRSAIVPDGMVICASAHARRPTMDRLVAAVVTAGMAVMARIDHAAAAATVDLTLRPTELLIFGSPRAGTRLMQASDTIGIDLPLRALVRQDSAGRTWLGYCDPASIARRHGAMPEVDCQLTAMKAVLETVAASACAAAPMQEC